MSTKWLAVIGIFCVVIAIFLYGRKRNKDKKIKIVPHVFTSSELKKVDEYTQFYLEQGLEIQSAILKAKQRVSNSVG